MKYLLRALTVGLIPLLLFGASSSVLAQRTVTGNTPSGDELTVAITENMTLEYPRRAMRLGVEGYVIMGFDISENGMPWNITVVESQPKRMFDKAAQRAIETMRFEKPTVDGVPAGVTGITMTLKFTL